MDPCEGLRDVFNVGWELYGWRQAVVNCHYGVSLLHEPNGIGCQRRLVSLDQGTTVDKEQNWKLLAFLWQVEIQGAKPRAMRGRAGILQVKDSLHLDQGRALIRPINGRLLLTAFQEG